MSTKLAQRMTRKAKGRLRSLENDLDDARRGVTGACDSALNELVGTVAHLAAATALLEGVDAPKLRAEVRSLTGVSRAGIEGFSEACMFGKKRRKR